ncbi:MAG: DUF1501 domain-containing protein [bacterium]|nr:DUF1501 domain-containing protein [bacterium]
MQLSRRTFLVQGLRVTALLPALPNLAVAARHGKAADRVLVVLQLSGGNDGLNTVIPYGQDAYYRMRPFLGLRKRELHALDDSVGLHPSLAGIAELYAEGRLAVVHGAGHPNPDRSHFRSLEIWHTADPAGPAGDVGWLGRMTDSITKSSPGALSALAIGAGNLPLSMRGESFLAPTVRDPRGFRASPEGEVVRTARDALLAGEAAGDLGFLRQAARSTYATAARMSALTDDESAADYPEHALAKELRLVAQLVRGGFGTRVFHLAHDGYDTHARQAPVHNELLRQVSTALTAFQRDLERAGIADRVVTLVFSEFGRRAGENASKGTDHGRGAPVFLMGEPVAGGQHGTAPDLERLVDGDVPSTADFRSIYSTLEEGWMGVTKSTAEPAMDLLRPI